MVGKRIALSRDHPYWNYISKLRKQGLDFELIEVDTDDVETIMLQIAFGIYDLTIVDSHQVRPNSMIEAGLSTKFILFEPLAHRWALRAESDQLHSALDKFIESEYRGIKYNLLHARYFNHPQEDPSLDKELVKVDSLSPYDEMTKHYSSKYGFDWRLITALMFQAIPLLMSVYANRFHTLSNLIRKIHDEYVWEKHIPPEWEKQLINLNGRVKWLKYTLACASFGFLSVSYTHLKLPTILLV